MRGGGTWGRGAAAEAAPSMRRSLARCGGRGANAGAGVGGRGGAGDSAPYAFTGFRRWSIEGYPAINPPWGTLNAVDLNTGEIKWKVPLGEYPELTAKGHSADRHGKLRRAGGDGEWPDLHRRDGRRDDPRLRQGHGQDPLGSEAAVRRQCDAERVRRQRQAVCRHFRRGSKSGRPAGGSIVAFALPDD